MSVNIRYCKHCIMPETRPDLVLDEIGVCNACKSFSSRSEIDWVQRRSELVSLLQEYREKADGPWDCIVPVSGGKDSVYQAWIIKELGFRPLCVTATTCFLSDIGRRNIETLKNLGLDYIEVSPDPKVRSRLNRIGLEQVGDISWPEHVSIFTIPVQVAVNYKVPLIIWGENAQNEFGGPATDSENHVLDRRWLEEFGGLLGLRVDDIPLVDASISKRDLGFYEYPSDEALKSVGVSGIYLGYFIPWDGFSNLLVSQALGFESNPSVCEGSFVNYENVDNVYHRVHDYFKYLKFGFSRATDQASLHIRRGRVERDTALKLVKLHDGTFPWEYLGISLADQLAPLGLTVEEFIGICDNFTNSSLFLKDGEGEYVRRKDGSPEKINWDNE